MTDDRCPVCGETKLDGWDQCPACGHPYPPEDDLSRDMRSDALDPDQ